MLCSYGCGQEATVIRKWGSVVCSANVMHCPAKKAKLSSILKATKYNGSTNFKATSVETLELCSYCKIHTAKFYYSVSGKYCCKQRASECPSSISRRHKTTSNLDSTEFTTDEKCSFGCGKTAKFKYNRGTKLCCSKNVSGCPAIKAKQQLAAKGRKVKPHPKHGYGKSGWYKGYWCDSSWELAWTVFHLEHGTPFTRCEDIFKYIDGEGIEREYHPDFKVFDYWIEIKGWETDKWKYKVAQFPYPDKLLVLKQTDLSEILAYVIDKYGKDFTYLYNEVREAA